ncbi:MAG TPA: DJ-1/PfpI family protein [Actinomycetota bacterium]|nr:DJ-1/PfpI family protein [Actinomycetota bacterium]
MQIAVALYPGLTALDAVGPYEVLRQLPDAEVRFVGAAPGPVVADSGVLFLGVTHTYEETPDPDVVLVPGPGPGTATTHWMTQPGLAAMGAKPQRGQRIVHAGKVATAAGVSAGIDLGLWLTGQIAGREHAETIQLYIEYDPQPPLHAGHPSKASKAVVGSAKTLGRRIASNPSEVPAVQQIAWQRVVGTFRKRKGLS